MYTHCCGRDATHIWALMGTPLETKARTNMSARMNLFIPCQTIIEMSLPRWRGLLHFAWNKFYHRFSSYASIGCVFLENGHFAVSHKGDFHPSSFPVSVSSWFSLCQYWAFLSQSLMTSLPGHLQFLHAGNLYLSVDIFYTNLSICQWKCRTWFTNYAG
jgi:hypothetical protein